MKFNDLSKKRESLINYSKIYSRIKSVGLLMNQFSPPKFETALAKANFKN